MEQLMERPVEALVQGPRHAKSVTTWGRIKWALYKGPARWNWKSNITALLFLTGVLIGVGIAMAFVAIFAVASQL